MTPTDLLIQGLSTAIPITLTSMILLFKFKTELCNQISKLTVKVDTHIKIAEKQEREFMDMKDRITNVILKNNLKY